MKGTTPGGIRLSNKAGIMISNLDPLRDMLDLWEAVAFGAIVLLAIVVVVRLFYRSARKFISPKRR